MKYACAVVVPSYLEPTPERTLTSLLACSLSGQKVLLVFVFNCPENSSDSIRAINLEGIKRCQQFFDSSKSKHNFEFIVLNELLSVKEAGVGLARKLGMDYAYEQLFQNGCDDAPIVCLDADCEVDRSYLESICHNFRQNAEANAASVYFEHEIDQANSSAIVEYELYLRYYIEGLRYCNYPFAYHTIGSSMAVRASVYKKCGGMNKRKAGEDFYFLHKLMPLGNFIEINNTVVYPLGRTSERVPFGTGRAMLKWQEEDFIHWPAYDPRIFETIKKFFDLIHSGKFYKDDGIEYGAVDIEPYLIRYLKEIKFDQMVVECKKNTSNEASFTKRLWGLLNGLVVLKCVHYLRDNVFENIPVSEAVNSLLKLNGTSQEQLILLRNKQRTYSA